MFINPFASVSFYTHFLSDFIFLFSILFISMYPSLSFPHFFLFRLLYLLLIINNGSLCMCLCTRVSIDNSFSTWLCAFDSSSIPRYSLPLRIPSGLSPFQTLVQFSCWPFPWQWLPPCEHSCSHTVFYL